MPKFLIFLIATFMIAQSTMAAYQVTVDLPAGKQAASATAVNADLKVETVGKIDGQHIIFSDLVPDSAYNLSITLTDGTVLQGVDMSWYSIELADPDAGPITDDDRKEITEIVEKVTSFFNKNHVAVMNATHERAVVLADQIRDVAFHSDKGGEVIWRPELWYFKFEHGGWEKIQESQKILRRERFANHDQFDQEMKNLRWVPQLGGIQLTKAKPEQAITLPAEIGVPPTSQPSDSPKP